MKHHVPGKRCLSVLPSTVLGQMRMNFPALSVGVRVNQCPLVMAHGCTQKKEWR